MCRNSKNSISYTGWPQAAPQNKNHLSSWRFYLYIKIVKWYDFRSVTCFAAKSKWKKQSTCITPKISRMEIHLLEIILTKQLPEMTSSSSGWVCWIEGEIKRGSEILKIKGNKGVHGWDFQYNLFIQCFYTMPTVWGWRMMSERILLSTLESRGSIRRLRLSHIQGQDQQNPTFKLVRPTDSISNFSVLIWVLYTRFNVMDVLQTQYHERCSS